MFCDLKINIFNFKVLFAFLGIYANAIIIDYILKIFLKNTQLKQINQKFPSQTISK
jgi:hypothetical protein